MFWGLTRDIIYIDMKLSKKTNYVLIAMAVFLLGSIVLAAQFSDERVFADDGSDHDKYFVTVYDKGIRTTVKTSQYTVGELLNKMHVILDDIDIVTPKLDTIVSSDMSIYIERSHPVVMIDGRIKKYINTSSFDPGAIAIEAGFPISNCDQIELVTNRNFLEIGAATTYEIKHNSDCGTIISRTGQKLTSQWVGDSPRRPLTAGMGRNRYLAVKLDGSVVERQETYYDLDMSKVMALAKNWEGCSHSGAYYVREDGVKIDEDGYVLIAAELNLYPRCSIVDTSLGLGKVYDTGAFALANKEQFDIATDWTNRNGY